VPRPGRGLILSGNVGKSDEPPPDEAVMAAAFFGDGDFFAGLLFAALLVTALAEGCPAPALPFLLAFFMGIPPAPQRSGTLEQTANYNQFVWTGLACIGYGARD
jgi:hypothetical protein